MCERTLDKLQLAVKSLSNGLSEYWEEGRPRHRDPDCCCSSLWFLEMFQEVEIKAGKSSDPRIDKGHVRC